MKPASALSLLVVAFLISILIVAQASAEYSKKVIVKSGDPAPGTTGAIFTLSDWNAPRVIGINDFGSVLFMHTLEVGVGDATTANMTGLWVYEGDSTRLVARLGTEVPGRPGDTLVDFVSGEIFFDLSGNIAFEGYIVTSSGLSESAFFTENSGTLAVIVQEGTTILPGITVLRFYSVAFNNGYYSFQASLEGTGVKSSNRTVHCVYTPNGIEVVARKNDPMHLITGGYKYNDVTSFTPRGQGSPITPSGEIIFQAEGYRLSPVSHLGAIYSWTPSSMHSLIEVSGIDSAGYIMGRWRMNLTGSKAKHTYKAYPSWEIGVDGALVVEYGDTFDSTGITIGHMADYVLYDNNTIGFQAGTSDNNFGIFIADASGVKKIVMKGDQAPGVPLGAKFTRMVYWMTNTNGRVAFPDLAWDGDTISAEGIWIGDTLGIDVVSLSETEIEVDSAVFKTISSHYIGDTYGARTGADGRPTLLNNSDQIAFGVAFYEGGTALVLASPGGLIVNSPWDRPDADPSDGICNTGYVLPDGSQECTLRAAITEANAQAGVDTIKFRIPDAPSITILSDLPIVLDTVLIDGSSQPIDGIVELNGANANLLADGLTIRGNGITVRSLMIGRFGGNGITITGNGDGSTGGNKIFDCYLGYTSTDGQDFGNGGSGIFIMNSSNNEIGGFGEWTNNHSTFNESNSISQNKSSGIIIDEVSGLSNNNIIRGNEIARNGRLGIDIGFDGVTFNDTSGTFDKITNFPEIDSALVIPGGPSTIYGSIREHANQDYTIDLFSNDACDSTLYGEGEFWEDSIVVVTNNQGVATFAISIPDEIDLNTTFFTATATRGGSTSEFSKCWPVIKKLKLVDYNKTLIANRDVTLSRAVFDPPKHTKEYVADLTTDADGIINITDYMYDGTFEEGDSIEVSVVLQQGTTIEPGVIDPTIMLDNGRFDPYTFDLSYDSLTSDTLQELKMENTTLLFDLTVSLEWDATRAYVTSLKSGLRQLANYLYDITDGQMTIRKIHLQENQGRAPFFPLYGFPDVLILADNMADGSFEGENDFTVYASRRFYQNKSQRANLSADENPMDASAPENWKRLAQLLASQLIGVASEHVSLWGTGCPLGNRDFGLMYWPWDDKYGGWMSEMSNSNSYANSGCMTEQLKTYGTSCWGLFVAEYQYRYKGILANIFSPDDGTPIGTPYNAGPNDHLADGSVNLQHDVGDLVEFVDNTGFSSAFDEKWTFDSKFLGRPLRNLKITTFRANNLFNHSMKQGRTADDGSIWIVGVNVGDTVWAKGRNREGHRRVWYNRKLEITAQKTFSSADAGVTVDISPITGDFPLLCSSSFDSSSIYLDIATSSPLNAAPTLTYEIDSLTAGDLVMTQSADGYSAKINNINIPQGVINVSTIDDSSNEFSFEISYKTVSVADSLKALGLVSFDGEASVILDTSATSIHKGMITSTLFPVIRDGILEPSIQTGNTYSVWFDNAVSLTGDNFITMYYDRGEFESSTGEFNSEESLKFFKWNESSSAWESIGGVVDTLVGLLAAPISSGGIYAAFTTDMVTSVEDNDPDANLPGNFIVGQNYPNPFNPNTIITYSLPAKSDVSVTIFNILGQNIRQFNEGTQSAGSYSISWDSKDDDGKRVASGVYFYRVIAGDKAISKKMVLLK